MGNLFYRGVSVTEIKKMPYWEMKYWNTWHEVMLDAEVEARKPKKGR